MLAAICLAALLRLTALAQSARTLRGLCASPPIAKRLECAVSRRCVFVWFKDGSGERTESAGIRRTPNASRGSATTLPRWDSRIVTGAAAAPADSVFGAPLPKGFLPEPNFGIARGSVMR